MNRLAETMATLSSAEEFFDFFGVEYDARILAASRLHILKRFHDNLATVEGLEDMEAQDQRAAYRAELTKAYGDFVTGSALTMRVFPRLRAPRGAFVALSSVQRTTKEPA